MHPYDVLEAEPEVVSGYYVDYGGVVFMVIYLAEGVVIPRHTITPPWLAHHLLLVCLWRLLGWVLHLLCTVVPLDY